MIESRRKWGAAALIAVTTGLAAGCQERSSTAVAGSVGTSAGSPSNGESSSGQGGRSSSGSGTSSGSSSGGAITDGGPCLTGSLCVLSNGGVSRCCDGTCPDVFNDRENCGGCGFLCEAGATCSAGVCVFSSCAGVAPYSPGLLASLSRPLGVGCVLDGSTNSAGLCCNGDCLSDDVLGTDANCGGCGLSCPPGSRCLGAACEDDAGAILSCAPGLCPAGSACVASFAGIACLPTVCGADGTSCALPTAEQGECCGGRCTDPRHDSANCNGCGDVCPADTACVFSTCAPAARCVPSQDGNPCALDGGRGGICCGSICVDPDRDSQNCGDCAAICASGGSCIQGACLDPLSLNEVSCYLIMDGGASCPPGTACLSANECRPLDCDGGAGEGCVNGICCSQGCTDLAFDPLNCGECGAVCASGLCVYGTCMPPAGDAPCPPGCPTGSTCFNGMCLSSQCDTLLCAFSTTQVGYCCDEQGCIDVAHDPQNCGGCSVACPDGQTCDNGVCSGTPAVCQGGNLGGYCNLDGGWDWICCQGSGCIDVGDGFCP